ncbi:hypothetical protein J6590_001559 [Homalodisca vitripennis]|nr:hypothetical protein J6590_001559 [Homalodisca vitripennis]
MTPIHNDVMVTFSLSIVGLCSASLVCVMIRYYLIVSRQQQGQIGNAHYRGRLDRTTVGVMFAYLMVRDRRQVISGWTTRVWELDCPYCFGRTAPAQVTLELVDTGSTCGHVTNFKGAYCERRTVLQPCISRHYSPLQLAYSRASGNKL